jgi:protein-tyrosine phosphatase
MPRPRGGDWLEDEISALKQLEVDAVVSLLESHEITDLDISDEARLCREQNIEFLSFPIVDRNIPFSLPEFSRFAKNVASLLSENKSIVVHCRQGVGRAGLLAACVLILHGVSADDALSRISQARGCVVPETEEQKAFVEKFANGTN